MDQQQLIRLPSKPIAASVSQRDCQHHNLHHFHSTSLPRCLVALVDLAMIVLCSMFSLELFPSALRSSQSYVPLSRAGDS